MIVLAAAPAATLNIWLLAAGVFSSVAVLVHVFAGGREIARPLLEARDLDDVAKFTAYCCWHLVTFTLAAMALTYGLAAFAPSMHPAAWVFFGLTALFAVWSIVLAVSVRQPLLKLPQWILFALPAGAGLWFADAGTGASPPM